MSEIFPSAKNGNKLVRGFSLILSVLIPTAAIFALIIGIFLIADEGKLALGIMLIAAFALVTAAQIIGAIIIYKRNNGD